MKKRGTRERDGQLVIKVHVVPRAARSQIVGEHNGALRVKIAAPPVDGAANEELIKLLAKTFEVSKSAVSILGGHSSRIKLIRIENVKPEHFDLVRNLSPKSKIT